MKAKTMSDASARDIEQRFSVIRKRERSFAGTVAARLIEMRPVGVWHFMLPILFPLDYLRVRRARDTFIVNFLFTKELALEAARDVAKGEIDREDAHTRLRDETMRLVDTVEPGLYSIDIQKRQVEEMACLVEHYVRLLGAKGEDYAELVRKGYGSREEFLSFLDALQEAERETGKAAARTLGHAGDTGLLERMDRLTGHMRRREVERIFSTNQGTDDAE